MVLQRADVGLAGEPPRTGTQIGRYVVGKPLGRGATGLVVSAHDPGLDRYVAVKLIHRGKSSQDVAVARLLREARALAKVSHPNVVTVHDVGEAGGEAFIAMEMVEGVTLSKWLRSTPRDWREVLDCFIAAARGLAAVHAAGLVHRDFKPDNVMVDAAGHVRVMDFGLAHAGNEPRRRRRCDDVVPFDTRLSFGGAINGTPAYMAPEHHLGLPTDARSDQFSFCVALYEALCGERPFTGGTPTAVAVSVCHGPPPRMPSGVRAPRWLRRAVLKGLHRRPRRRHASMEALLQLLERGRRRRRRALKSVAAVAAAVALSAVSAWAGTHWPSGQTPPGDASVPCAPGSPGGACLAG